MGGVIYQGERIGIANALEIRSQYKGKDFKTPFTCVHCGNPVRAHKEGAEAVVPFQAFCPETSMSVKRPTITSQ